MFANFATVLRDDVPVHDDARRARAASRNGFLGDGNDDGLGWIDVDYTRGRRTKGGRESSRGSIVGKGGGGRGRGRDDGAAEGQRGEHVPRALGAGGGVDASGPVAAAGGRGAAEQSDKRVVVAMFNCEQCGKRSFLTRRSCFACGQGRPERPRIVEERWKAWALPKGVGASVLGDAVRGVEGERTRQQQERRPTRAEPEGIPGTRRRWASPAERGRGISAAASPQLAREGPWGGGQSSGGGVATGKGGGGAVSHAVSGEREEFHARPAVEQQQQVQPPQPQVQQQQRAGAEEAQGERGPTSAAPMGTGQVGRGGGNEAGGSKEGWPVMPQPYAPPPLPRHLLASRAEQLEGRIAALQKNPGDPRLEVAQRSLESTRVMLREAGGPTERRLAFSALDADDKIRRAEGQLAQDQEDLAKANQSVAEALEQQARMEAKVRASEQLLKNARARHAHLAFQIAVEAGRNASGYDELVVALTQVEAHVLASGGESIGEAQGRVSRFVRMFKLAQYNKDEDPVLQEVASVGSQGSNATLIVGSWLEEESAAEMQAVQEQNKEKAKGGSKEENAKARRVEKQEQEGGGNGGQGVDASLEKVRAAAASACVHLQIGSARQEAEAYNIASVGCGEFGRGRWRQWTACGLRQSGGDGDCYGTRQAGRGNARSWEEGKIVGQSGRAAWAATFGLAW